MVISKKVKITSDEALRYLFKNNSILIGLLASVLACILGFLLIIGVLYLGKIAPFKMLEFLVLLGIFLVLGVFIYFLRRQEFHYFETTSSNVFLNGIFVYPVLIIFFTALLLYFLLPQWAKVMEEQGAKIDIVAAVITVFLVSVAVAYFYNGLWKTMHLLFMKLFAQTDWVIVAEKDYFIAGLSLRFEEAKRYGTSLSMVNVKIDIPNNKKKLLNSVYNKMQNTLREIDAISHYESLNNIVLLAPVTRAAAVSMFKRVIKVMREELFKQGYKEKIEIEAGISSIMPETESEFELLKPQEVLREFIEIG